MERYGIRWLQKGTHEKHLSVLDYKKQERAREIAELDSQVQQKTDEIIKLDIETADRKNEFNDMMNKQARAEADAEQAQETGKMIHRKNEMLLKENSLLIIENENLARECEQLETDKRRLNKIQETLRADNRVLSQEYEKRYSENLQAAQEQEKLRADQQKLAQQNQELCHSNEKLMQKEKRMKQKISHMMRSTEKLERDIRSYDEDKAWQLPETGPFMSAKAYREKSAQPLVEKLKDRVKNLTLQCVQLMDDRKRLREKTEQQGSDIQFYKGRIHEVFQQSQHLQEKADDLERIRQYAGAGQIDELLARVREQERAKYQHKRMHCMER